MDLRERIVAAREAGESVTSIARRFAVCTKTVYQYCAKARAGELTPRRHPGRAPRIGPDQEAGLLALMRAKPDTTLDELRELWHEQSGVWIARSTLHDGLRRAGLRFKKKRA